MNTKSAWFFTSAQACRSAQLIRAAISSSYAAASVSVVSEVVARAESELVSMA